MSRDARFLLIAGIVVLIFSAFEAISLFVVQGKTAKVTGTIIDIQYAVNPTMKKNNSKWAIFSYVVNGEHFISSNRIQVPLTSEVGDKIQVSYFTEKPDKLNVFSIKKLVISLVIAIGCFVVAYLL